MSSLNLAGMSIPLVTPFQNDDALSIDFEKMSKLVDFLIDEQEADSLVAIGTTGESTSLSHTEKESVITHAIKATRGRVPVLVGTGSACTNEAIELTRFSEKAGAAGILLVSPYYIRPNQDGLYNHFLKVAKSTNLPIVLYNHPGRTGVSIEVSTLIKLINETDNIVAIKDCPNSLAITMDLTRRTKAEAKRPFSVLTGEDENLFVNLCLGADGAIAATAHLFGKEIKQMIKAFRDRDLAKARELQFALIDFQRLLFAVPSPAPIKAALDLMGTNLGGSVRPPLADVPKDFLPKLESALKKIGKL